MWSQTGPLWLGKIHSYCYAYRLQLCKGSKCRTLWRRAWASWYRNSVTSLMYVSQGSSTCTSIHRIWLYMVINIMHGSARRRDKCLMHMPVISPARAAIFAMTKLHAQIMSWVSSVYECRSCTKILPEATSTIMHKFKPLRAGCCWSSVAVQTMIKLPCVLQLQSSSLRVAEAALWLCSLHQPSTWELRKIFNALI